MGGVKETILAFIPIFSRKYWYITVYMLLLFFSEFINFVPERLKRKEFEKLLLLMFLIFSVIPTFIMKDTMGSGGKDVVVMLMVYWIGCYIRMYIMQEDYKKWIKRGVAISIIGGTVNMVLTFLLGGKQVVAPFARDCSFTILMGSIAFFCLFLQFKPYYSKLINKIAKHVIAIYLFERAVRAVIDTKIELVLYLEKWYFFSIVATYVFMVLLICIIADSLRSIIMDKIDDIIIAKVVFWWKKLFLKIESYNKK